LSHLNRSRSSTLPKTWRLSPATGRLSERVFVNDRGQPVTYSRLRTPWEAARRESGFRLHDLRTSCVTNLDLEEGRIHWQGDEDKIDYDHRTPISGEALVALTEERRRRPTIGATWVFPAPKNSRQACSHDLMGKWWKRAESFAGFEPVRQRGWHSLRRKFASELKDIALADLRDLGGWKDHNTILRCYQRPDEERMREALANRRQRREMGVI